LAPESMTVCPAIGCVQWQPRPQQGSKREDRNGQIVPTRCSHARWSVPSQTWFELDFFGVPNRRTEGHSVARRHQPPDLAGSAFP
jgi:hypothetical protein